MHRVLGETHLLGAKKRVLARERCLLRAAMHPSPRGTRLLTRARRLSRRATHLSAPAMRVAGGEVRLSALAMRIAGRERPIFARSVRFERQTGGASARIASFLRASVRGVRRRKTFREATLISGKKSSRRLPFLVRIQRSAAARFSAPRGREDAARQREEREPSPSTYEDRATVKPGGSRPLETVG